MSWNLIDLSRLRKIELFEHVSDDALAELVAITKTPRYKPGDLIFRKGDPGDALCFVLEGKVRISTDIDGVGEEALAFLEQGDSFGEMALLEADAERSAHAIAGSDCQLGIIPRSEFLELMDSDPAMANEILWSFVTTLAARLRRSNEKLEFFALSHLHG